MKLTFLGHSGFRIESGQHVLIIDPFITGQGRSEAELKQWTSGATHILLTHGHGDHVGDTVAIAKANNDIPVVGMVELVGWLNNKHGVKNTKPINFGGTADLGGGVTVSLVPAWHTSSADDGTYLGNPAGIIIKAEGKASDQGSAKTIYHMGDTCAFLDMQLIANRHAPDVVLVPIGDGYTMGADEAALACHFVNSPTIKSSLREKTTVSTIIPIHYATFPGLAPNADAFIAACQPFNLPTPTALKPGEDVTL